MILRALLFVTWLMLNGSASPGHLLLGAVLALAIPPLVRPGLARPRKAGALLRLAGTVALDIVRSNVDVARRVLGRDAAIHPRWIWVPLQLRSDEGLALLASIITLTPGTISAEFSADRRRLRVHLLHAEGDAQDVIDSIHERYERPLLEIYG